MDTDNELRLRVLDAWRDLPAERRQTDDHAAAFARDFASRLVPPGVSGPGFEQVLAWLKEDLRISRAIMS